MKPSSLRPHPSSLGGTSAADRPLITTHREWTRHGRRLCTVGVVLGLFLAAALHHLSKAEVVADPVMERACGWPTHEGEYLWVTIEGGKIKCGKYK